MLIDEDDDNTPVSQLLTQKSKKGKEAVPNDKEEMSQGESSGDEGSSGGEGSDYGNKEFNEEVRSKRKERKERKEKNRKRPITKNKKLKPGDKNVSAEAFAKLDGGNSDDDSVTENLQSPSVKQHPAVAKLGRGRQHKPFSPSGNQTAITLIK